MPDPDTLIRPIFAFEDNLRPAKLMLDVYRLLDCGDAIQTDGDFVNRLRDVVKAAVTEDLMVVQNEIFLGLIRERAGLPKSALKTATLTHLLRQAIVASCTALDTYLPAMLRLHLPEMIRIKGRGFLPQDPAVLQHCNGLTFSIDEVLRVMEGEAETLFISNKLLGYMDFKYLSQSKGVHVTGALLGLDKPWDAIALHLNRERNELVGVIDMAVKRRNDIVHRADRAQAAPGGDQQPLTFAQARQTVDTIGVVCFALDELVNAMLRELRNQKEPQ